jgi:hypothetical protein
VGAGGGSPPSPAAAPSLGDLGLAMVGDAGEVVECLRRLARDEWQRERLVGELGDVWLYWTRLASATGASPAELLRQSRLKIEARIGAAAGSTP